MHILTHSHRKQTHTLTHLLPMLLQDFSICQKITEPLQLKKLTGDCLVHPPKATSLGLHSVGF